MSIELPSFDHAYGIAAFKGLIKAVRAEAEQGRGPAAPGLKAALCRC